MLKSQEIRNRQRKIVKQNDLNEAVSLLVFEDICVSKAEARRVYHQIKGRLKEEG